MWTSRGFISPTARTCFGIWRSLVGRGGPAEEITQETFAKALKAIDRFQGDKDIRSLAVYHCQTHVLYPLQAGEADHGGGISPVHPRTEKPLVEQIIDRERAFQVHRFLHGMREPYKEVFTLRVFGELPFEKIGLLFGKTPSWARVTFYRAKKQIIEYMEGIENEHHPL